MDTGLLNLGSEHFSTYDSFEDVGLEDSSSLDDNNLSKSEWEDQEISNNGDIALIPTIMTNNFYQVFNDSDSPTSELYQKDWTKLLDIDVIDVEGDNDFPSNFDLTTYINDSNITCQRKLRAGCKKIDIKAQKYIVEDEDIDVDVETVTDDNNPVLEALDPFSLLEQFEANETQPKNDNRLVKINNKNLLSSNNNIIEKPSNVETQTNLNKKSIDTNNINNNVKIGKINNNKKQILDALPKDLIQRINESGKRKTITVIDPIPNKKQRTLNNLKQSKTHLNKIIGDHTLIQLDHNYCSLTTVSCESKKDSGFVSSEEDERNIIRIQPLVKNNDGKLMVSLLKVNTIRKQTKDQQQQQQQLQGKIQQEQKVNDQKKKLNLEEYKKRRFINVNKMSASSSGSNSNCSSPSSNSPQPPIEDENHKAMKHQQKLMKMAADLLKSTPKKQETITSPESIDNDKLNVNNVIDETKNEQLPNGSNELLKSVVTTKTLPDDLEVKTFINVACNTDFDDSLNSVEEIKPLLQKVGDKITANSFITSLIANIPKVTAKINSPKHVTYEVVRENKTIQYLKKNRPIIKTRNVCCQTNICLLGNSNIKSRYRRRNYSTSSNSSNDSSSSYSKKKSTYSKRSFSSDSNRSRSRSRSRSFSRSRSRSISPRRYDDKYEERLREVEERRVIFVGHLPYGTTKDVLRKRFKSFGPITNISIHFRGHGDNYGFVTFVNKEDAFEALEHANDGPFYPKYELSFGGRRIFCKTTYSDLDNMRDDYYSPSSPTPPQLLPNSSRADEIPFDILLQATKEKLLKRKP